MRMACGSWWRATQALHLGPKRRLCSVRDEKRAVLERHTVAVTPIAKDAFGPLRRTTSPMLSDVFGGDPAAIFVFILDFELT